MPHVIEILSLVNNRWEFARYYVADEQPPTSDISKACVYQTQRAAESDALSIQQVLGTVRTRARPLPVNRW